MNADLDLFIKMNIIASVQIHFCFKQRQSQSKNSRKRTRDQTVFQLCDRNASKREKKNHRGWITCRQCRIYSM